MKADLPMTLGVTFPVVKMSHKILKGKRGAGQIAKYYAHRETFWNI